VDRETKHEILVLALSTVTAIPVVAGLSFVAVTVLIAM
jgi:hypothetical protein